MEELGIATKQVWVLSLIVGVAFSRFAPPYSTTEQIILREGMVVEDVTNGTFYTIGEIGRNWIEAQYTSNGMYYTGSTVMVVDPQFKVLVLS